MAIFRNFDSLGAVVPYFCPDKREIWHGVADHVYRGNVSPLRSEKPMYGPLSKNRPAGSKNITLFLSTASARVRDPRSSSYLAW